MNVIPTLEGSNGFLPPLTGLAPGSFPMARAMGHNLTPLRGWQQVATALPLGRGFFLLPRRQEPTASRSCRGCPASLRCKFGVAKHNLLEVREKGQQVILSNWRFPRVSALAP